MQWRSGGIDAFAKESGDLKTNIAAVNKAVAALEKGQAGAFLQTESAAVLTRLVENDEKMVDVDREDFTAFLSGSDSHGYHHRAVPSQASGSRWVTL